MKYYKAEISLATEFYELNAKGEYDGINPDSYQDQGVIMTLQDGYLTELKKKIAAHYFCLEKPAGADVQVFEGRIEIQYDGEYDYRTPLEDQVPFIETASIYISEVEENTLEDEELEKLLTETK